MLIIRRSLRTNEIQQFLKLSPIMRASSAQEYVSKFPNLADQIHDISKKSRALEDFKQTRLQLSSLPTQSTGESTAEIGSIILCAAAGALSASLHYGFLSLFGLAFWLNRKSTASIRRRQEATVQLGLINQDIARFQSELSKAEKDLMIMSENSQTS
jgi:hypothetical protein